MSRSRKKNPIIKGGKKSDRQIHHRRFRSINKQRIKEGKEPLLKEEVTNPYNLMDYTCSLFDFEIKERVGSGLWTEKEIESYKRGFKFK